MRQGLLHDVATDLCRIRATARFLLSTGALEVRPILRDAQRALDDIAYSHGPTGDAVLFVATQADDLERVA